MKNSYEILRYEFEELKKEPLSISGYTIELFDQDIYQWRITLLGAKDTPYADGIFFIKLLFPKDYPDSPPTIYFLTPIYHMNVHPSNGHVDVNFVKYDWQKTSKKVREILIKLYSIFYLENPDSPYSRYQRDEFLKDRDLYYFKKETFTKKYANIKSFKDFKLVNWDFSFPPKTKFVEINKYLNNNEKIRLSFNINGELKKYCIDCYSNLLLGKLMHRIIGMVGIIHCPLIIYEGRKLEEYLTLRENGLKSESHITIIHSVHY